MIVSHPVAFNFRTFLGTHFRLRLPSDPCNFFFFFKSSPRVDSNTVSLSHVSNALAMALSPILFKINRSADMRISDCHLRGGQAVEDQLLNLRCDNGNRSDL